MERQVLRADDAACILFGDLLDEENVDWEQAQFRSGADVCASLASHFGFTNEDYEQISQRRRRARAQGIEDRRPLKYRTDAKGVPIDEGES